METNFAADQILKWLLSIQSVLANQILTPENLSQIPAVFITFVVAWIIGRASAPVLRLVFHHMAVDEYQESFYVNAMIPLAVPLLWVAGLWISIAVAGQFNWPSNVIGIAINLAGAWLIIRFASSLIPNATVSRVVAVLAWTAAALNILGLLTPTIALLRETFITIGQFHVSIFAMLEGILSLAFLLWASVLVAGLVERRIEKVSTLTPTARVLFGKLFKIFLIALAFMVSLASVGIDLTAFAVFTGAVGVGIGFGLQKSVANLFAGIILLLDKSIKPGDILEVAGTYGWVSSLGARYVEVETRDGTAFLIPNEDIITQQVFNWTHQHNNVRLKLPVRIAFDSDVRKALDLMREAADRPERVLEFPRPNPLVIGFGENGLDLELRFWIADVHNGIHNISSDVLLEILDLFRANGIQIPLPQRDIHVQSLPRHLAVGDLR
jgi:small-conductance mechanosensitive channel